MSTGIRYYCPHCQTVVTMPREGYLADKSVTPFPLEGWSYVAPDEDFADADGVRFLCGESGGVEWSGDGCREPFYLSFVRFEDGREVEPAPESEYVELAGVGPRRPRGPDGPTGPG